MNKLYLFSIALITLNQGFANAPAEGVAMGKNPQLLEEHIVKIPPKNQPKDTNTKEPSKEARKTEQSEKKTILKAPQNLPSSEKVREAKQFAKKFLPAAPQKLAESERSSETKKTPDSPVEEQRKDKTQKAPLEKRKKYLVPSARQKQSITSKNRSKSKEIDQTDNAQDQTAPLDRAGQQKKLSQEQSNNKENTSTYDRYIRRQNHHSLSQKTPQSSHSATEKKPGADPHSQAGANSGSPHQNNLDRE
jgi:hypothetical protein